MNLNKYDTVNEIRNDGCKVIPKYKRLYSYSIPFKPFYAIAKRYDTKCDVTSYYLILSNVILPNKDFHSTNKYGSNGIKVSLADIWNISPLKSFVSEASIVLRKEDSDADTDVYLIDI